MGTQSSHKAIPDRPAGLADALFSQTQQRVLGLLFGQPDRSFYLTELIRLIGAGRGAVQRELARLERSGLVTVSAVGTQKHFKAEPTSPLFDELCSIARKTVGLAEPLREALAPLASGIRAAFVYGSVAKRQDTASSDIDVMILGDRVSYPEVYSALEPLSGALGRTVNPTVMRIDDYRKRIEDGPAFVARVNAQPKLWIIGGESDLTA